MTATELRPASPALRRAAALLAEAHRGPVGHVRAGELVDGYLDVTDGVRPEVSGRAQRLMLSETLPRVYEHFWRPAWSTVATGVFGPSGAEERRIMRLLLGLTPGDGVLDVACGPGNTTRELAGVVGAAGLAVGLDASPTMLARAVADTELPQVGFVRGDAEALPFRDASFDGVCCFAALYLIADWRAALADMARVLTPGGRLAIFTSCRPRSAPLRTAERWATRLSSLRMFERDEVTDALAALGLVDVVQRATGLAQFVGARRPG